MATLPHPLDREADSLIVDRARAFMARYDLDEDVFISRYGARGARPHFEDDLVPDLRFPSIIPPRGFDLPLVKEYDRTFLLKTGLRPPVSPAGNPRLRALTVPLSPTTKSFDDARLLVEEGHWPRPRNVRAEDFLAALRYEYSPPLTGQLDLRLAGGPAPFSSSGSQLLQIVAQAGDAIRERPLPVHVVVALDVSNSMRWSRKLESARQAVSALLARLTGRDQVTLIVFNDRVRMVFDRGRKRELPALQRLVSTLLAGGGTDVCAAADVALKHAIRHRDGTRRTEVVLVTDDRSTLASARVADVARLINTARRQRVGLTVVDVDQGDEHSPALDAWASAAGREVESLPSPEAIRWSLVDVMMGNSVVARRVSVRVQFDPAVVLAYRLIGHDISHVQSPVEVQADAVLRSRESAMCLFEVWLKPGKLGRLAAVELNWTDREG